MNKVISELNKKYITAAEDHEMVEELIDNVKAECQASAFSNYIKALKQKVISKMKKFDASFSPEMELRRNKDGVTQVDWLIEKMVGEYLIDKRIDS